MTAVQKTAQPFAEERLLQRVRVCIAIVIAGLFVSGVTAFPLAHEVGALVRCERWLALPRLLPEFCGWIEKVSAALNDTAARYPFLAYGTDWLAFAHVLLAVLFFGPYRDPVRNRWVLQFGLIACAGVLPLAWIAGPVRGIPPFWRVIDSSFGVIGAIPLLLALRDTNRLHVSQQFAGPGFKMTKDAASTPLTSTHNASPFGDLLR